MPFTEHIWQELSSSAELSPRQTEIVHLLFEGLADKQIASRLGIRLPTVRTHMSRLFLKLDVNDRCELLIHFFRKAKHLCGAVDCPLRKRRS